MEEDYSVSFTKIKHKMRTSLDYLNVNQKVIVTLQPHVWT